MSQVLTPPKTDQYEQAALAWAQEFGYKGTKLPKGERQFPFVCPLAKATGLSVGSLTADDGHTVYDLPANVARFVALFDAGDLPHLDLDMGE